MTQHVHASLPLDGLRGPLTPGERISQQIQIVLGTRPGQMPWRPDFGCDLSSLVGQPASAQNLSLARRMIGSALKQWLPDVEYERIEVKAVRESEGHQSLSQRSLPLAETALLTLGTQVRIEVHLEVRVPRGTAVVTATVNP